MVMPSCFAVKAVLGWTATVSSTVAWSQALKTSILSHQLRLASCDSSVFFAFVAPMLIGAESALWRLSATVLLR